MLSASVTAKEEGERRPEDYACSVARHFADLASAPKVGEEAARRAEERIGSGKVSSKPMTLLVENRAAPRLVASLVGPLAGGALQQHRSCFEGRLGQTLGSPLLSLVNEPLLPRALGSRTYDSEGLAVRRQPVFTDGRLDSYFIDVYYGRKTGLPPTTGSISNLLLTPGSQTLEELIGDIEEGILVTSFLGGNSNPATGDFSFGVSGSYIKGGALIRPVSEMNITGSHLTLWRQLDAVGNDPYPWSPLRIPSLLFDNVQFSGM
jgi:PmbA protein